jgi:hypothetical protein
VHRQNSVEDSKTGRRLSGCGAYDVVQDEKSAAAVGENGTAADFVALLAVAFAPGLAIAVLEIVAGEGAVGRTH